MLHPFCRQTKTVLYYHIGWVVLAFLHWLVLHSVTDLPLLESLTDALVYNLVLLPLSLSFWYPLVYADKTSSVWMQLANNLVVFASYLFIWLWGSKYIAGIILEGSTTYAAFSNSVWPIRAFIGSMLLLLIAMVYHLFDFYHSLEEKKLNEETMKKLLKEAELSALKAQLNPHFLFNSLNSIGALTITDPDMAREMVNKLSDFLRLSLRSKNDMAHALAEELENVERYLAIEKVRFGNRLCCENNIDDDCWDAKLPAMLLQPLYENAIKHGVYESLDTVNIRTYCRRSSLGLEISIVNNFDPESTPVRGEGVGLANVQNRLKAIYLVDGLMTVSRENNHFEVTLTIPQPHAN
jgi:two-component system, LytTR family, sensor kinase